MSLRSYVIDSWPVLEWLQDKPPAAQAFEDFVERCLADRSRLFMSRINYGEVVYTLAKRFTPLEVSTCLRRMADLPIDLLSVDDDLIDEAAALKGRFALSYADTFAVAQAIRLECAVVTGDREFLKLQEGGLIHLEWLGA
jgi:predicted nucleic acid-binding protein